MQQAGRVLVLPAPHVLLPGACVEMQHFERAVEWGQEAERVVESLTSAASSDLDDCALVMRQTLFILYATLACAFEGLGRIAESMQYHDRAVNTGILNHGSTIAVEVMTLFEREARLLLGQGKAAEAAQLLVNTALSNYIIQLEKPGGLGKFSAAFRCLLLALRRLIDIKRQLGKEAEARALDRIWRRRRPSWHRCQRQP